VLRADATRKVLAVFFLASLAACSGQSPSEPATVASVVLTPTSSTLESVGSTVQMAASASDAAGATIPGKSFTWASLDEGVARVSSSGVVTAVANGTATITATSDGVSGSATVVVDQAVVSVVVSPEAATLTALGDAVALSAAALDGGGHPIADVGFTWSSADESVVEVSSQGEAVAVSEGSVMVTASTEGVSGSANVTVDQSVAEILVAPNSVTLTSLGETATLVAEGRGAGGATVADAVFTWTSTAESAATVSDAGVVTAVANGAATVMASANGVSGSADVLVDQAVESVEVTPPADTIVVGGVTSLTAEGFDALGSVVADDVHLVQRRRVRGDGRPGRNRGGRRCRRDARPRVRRRRQRSERDHRAHSSVHRVRRSRVGLHRGGGRDRRLQLHREFG